ncbi:MAG: PaaI family thioesterase [Xanthobacteraceae bacterium]|nr:PaaI family thioesterase [Xanthobacteraceae bacterium]
MRVNPDQALLKRFLADPATPVAIDSNPLGTVLRGKLCDRKGDTLRIAFEPGREFIQGNDVVQGGIVATMLDMTAAFAVLATLPDDRTAATASLTVSFLAAVRPGPLLATGLVERAGRRLIFARAQLQSEPDGALLATANVVMSVLELRVEHR